jgi:hypothetical protein
MAWPQYVFLALLLMGAGTNFSRWGETKKPDTYGGWSWLVANVIIFGILWCGGFFHGGARWP